MRRAGPILAVLAATLALLLGGEPPGSPARTTSSSPTLEAGTRTPATAPASPAAPTSTTGTATGTLLVLVRLPDRAPADGAEVTLVGDEVGAHLAARWIDEVGARADATGEARLAVPTRPARLAVARRGDLEGWARLAPSGPTTVDLRPLDAPLPGTGSIVVAVTDPFGPLRTRLFVEEGPGLRRFSMDTVVSADSRFTLRDLAPGCYVLDVQCRREMDAAVERVEVAAGRVVRLDVAFGAAVGRLLLPPGVAPSAVEARTSMLEYSAGVTGVAEVTSDGYRVRGLTGEGPLRVTAWAPGWLEGRVELAAGRGLVVGPDLRIGRGPARLVGRLVAARTGRPVEGHVTVWNGDGRASASAGPDGRFALAGLLTGTYELVVTGDGFELRRGVVVDEPDGDLGDLPLPDPPARFVVEVVEADGRPAPGARVLLRADEGRGGEEQTDEAGRAGLHLSGRGWVAARSADRARCAPPVPVDLSRGEPRVRLVLTEATGGLEVAILNDEGGFCSVWRRCERHGDRGCNDQPDDFEQLDLDRGWIDGLRPGRWSLRGQTALIATFEVQPGRTARVDLRAAATTGSLELRLEGRPATKAVVKVVWTPVGDVTGGVRSVETTEEVTRLQVPVGPVEVTASWDRLGGSVVRRARVIVPADGAAVVVFAWPGRGSITGQRDGHGLVVAESDDVRVEAPTTAGGAFRLEGLPPGRYRVAGLDGRRALDPDQGTVVDVGAGPVAAGRVPVLR